MMRWLLLFLIVLNVVVLFWFGQQQKAEDGQVVGGSSVSTAGAPGIALLSEVPARKIKYKKPAPKEPEPPAPVPEPLPAPVAVESEPAAENQSVAAAPAAEPHATPAAMPEEKKPAEVETKVAQAKPVINGNCGFLGPFAEPITVRQVSSRLKRAQVDTKIYSESLKIDPIFWVYLPPAESRAAALMNLRQLQAARIESFIVGEGADINAISLGFYKKKSSAEAIQKQRIEQGYDARLTKKDRNRQQYWVVAQPQGWARVDAALLAELRAEYGEFTRRSRKCGFVASYTQFE